MFVVVLLFLIAGHPQSRVVSCADMACVQDILDRAPASFTLARLQVWKRDDYAPLPLGDRYVWPAMIDMHYH